MGVFCDITNGQVSFYDISDAGRVSVCDLTKYGPLRFVISDEFAY